MRNIIAKYTLKLFLVVSLITIVVFGFLIPDEISSRYKKETFWAEKTHCQSIYNVVFTGDSRTYHGISPQVIQNCFKYPVHVLNFGYSAAGLNPLLLNNAKLKLDSTKHLKILVLGVTPLSLTLEASRNSHFTQEKCRTSYDIYERKYANKYLSFFEPTSIQSLVNHFSGNKKGYYENFKEDGWIAAEKNPSDTNEAFHLYANKFSNTRVEDVILDSIMSITNACKNQGIQLYAYRPPTTKALKHLEDSIMNFNEEKFISHFELAGGKWISIPDSMKFNTYDGSHLDETSAVKLSIFLGTILYQANNSLKK